MPPAGDPEPGTPPRHVLSGGAARDDGHRDWVPELGGSGPVRDEALAALHAMLLRIAHSELRRRAGQLRVTGPELDDLAAQSANDALLAIISKLDQFRGESRFTTWAYTFVTLEVSSKLGRHFWRRPTVSMETEDWDRLPDRLGMEPSDAAEHHELLVAMRRAIEGDLSDRQRLVFTAIVLNGIPVDALAVQLGTNRNALYKTMFDARRKIRAVLAANGYLDISTDPPSDARTGTQAERRS